MRIALLANPDNVHVQRWVDFLRARGHELLVIADPHTHARLPDVDIEIPKWGVLSNILAFRLTPKPHGNALWKWLHYRPIIRRFNPDVVHGFEAYYNGLATAWSGGFPTVLTPWGKDVHHDAFKGPLWKWIVTRALRGVDLITTNDDSMQDYLNREFGIAREKVQPFSWGVDLSIFNPDHGDAADDLRGELGIGERDPVVFSPRKFHPYWGAEIIVQAIPKILARRPSLKIILLAPDEDEFKSEMMARIETMGVASSVRWIESRVEPRRMAELFNLADAFISIPRTDLLAMTVLEGMACGCFPILLDHPAYRKHAPRQAGNEMNAIMLPEATPEALATAVEEAIHGNESRFAAADYNVERMMKTEDAAENMLQIEAVYERARHAHGIGFGV